MALTKSNVKTSEPDWATAYCEVNNVPFYLQNIDAKVTPEVRALLEEYSKIPSAEVLKHIYDIRARAWAIRSYPCTGLGLFLTPMITKCTAYQTIIRRLQRGESYMDVGCFLGQDIRRLVSDGAKSDRLYAVDIVDHWDLGFEMFRDRDRCFAQYIESNILDPTPRLQELRRSIDVLSITHVLHQWGWDDQVKALEQLVRLSNSNAMIVGFQVGSIGLKEQPITELAKSAAYWHDPASFHRMWEQVSRQTGTVWTCSAVLMTWDEIGWNPIDLEYLGHDARVIQWVSERGN